MQKHKKEGIEAYKAKKAGRPKIKINFLFRKKVAEIRKSDDYGSEEDLNLSEKELKKKYLSIIKKYFPQVDIRWAKVFKTNYAEPIYDIDYHKYMPNYRTPHEGLYFVGIQLTYPKIRNMNIALESGEKVADIIKRDFGLTT